MTLHYLTIVLALTSFIGLAVHLYRTENDTVVNRRKLQLNQR